MPSTARARSQDGRTPPAIRPNAFLYTPGTGTVDLNNLLPSGSGWTLNNGTCINDAGQIAGTGIINGQSHAFLLTPAVSPIQQLETALTTLINSSGLSTQVKTVLLGFIKSLPVAVQSLTPTQKALLIQQTNTFITYVQRLASLNKIPSSQATQLITIAKDIVNVLKS